MTDPESGEYAIREDLPTPPEFAALREAAGMTPRSREGIERGLQNSLYGVVAVAREDDGTTDDADGNDGTTDEVVGMARIVGDGGTVFHVCDMVVHPAHQDRRLGTRMMEALMGYLRENAPPNAYVNLMADVDGFYERFGFEETRPASKGMYLRTE